MEQAEKEQLIKNRVSKGFNENESRALLNELIERCAAGDNLDSALNYEGFKTSWLCKRKGKKV